MPCIVLVQREREIERYAVHDHPRLAGAHGNRRSFAGIVQRELAIECGQLGRAPLRAPRAADRELATGVVQAPRGVDHQGGEPLHITGHRPECRSMIFAALWPDAKRACWR